LEKFESEREYIEKVYSRFERKLQQISDRLPEDLREELETNIGPALFDEYIVDKFVGPNATRDSLKSMLRFNVNSKLPPFYDEHQERYLEKLQRQYRALTDRLEQEATNLQIMYDPDYDDEEIKQEEKDDGKDPYDSDDSWIDMEYPHAMYGRGICNVLSRRHGVAKDNVQPAYNNVPSMNAHGLGYHEGNWIQSAVEHKGSLTRQAKKQGLTPLAFARKNKNKKGKTGKRARLALTLHSFKRNHK
jgi:hypothetical protein